jgi:hypothetical protein
MRTVLLCLGLASAGFCVGSHWPAPPWVIVVLWVVGVTLWVLAIGWSGGGAINDARQSRRAGDRELFVSSHEVVSFYCAIRAHRQRG